MIYTNPRPIDAEQNYFGDEKVFYEEARLIFKGKKKHHRDRNYEYELKKIKRFMPKGKLLDIGTNMGFFLRKARDFGFITEGVEPSPSLSKIARDEWGLTIHTALLEQAKLPESSYDIITLIDVLEHITNPQEMLQACYKLINDDGMVVVKVPNGDYNHFKMKLGKMLKKQAQMDVWDCCEHVVHYTPKTFKRMVEKCNFKVVKSFIPLPINPPVWANLVGHYYQYPSPTMLDWKRVLSRRVFYWIGKVEKVLFKKTRFGPDLMFFIKKV